MLSSRSVSALAFLIIAHAGATKAGEPEMLDEPVTTIDQAIDAALAGGGIDQPPADARLSQLNAEYRGDQRTWSIFFRDGIVRYKANVENDRVSSRFINQQESYSDKRLWTDIPLATEIDHLDELVADAEQRVVEEGIVPEGLIMIDYFIVKNALPDYEAHLTVSFEDRDDEWGKAINYFNGTFDSVQPVKFVKLPSITPPKISVPQPEIPEIEVPVVEIPQIAVGIEVRENDELAIIRLPADILFDFDKADLRPDALATLTEVAGVLKARYDEDAPLTIHGHTDDRGKSSYNKRLSKERAEIVEKALLRSGILDRRMKVKAHGEKEPIAPNEHADGSDNPEGRQLNRRVEITVHRAG